MILTTIYERLNISISIPAATLIGLSIMLFVGFLLTRITKPLKLPNVTAYIFTGVLLGPVFRLIFNTEIIDPEVIGGMGFLADIALAFIAFGVGRFFKINVLKKSGLTILIITLFETFFAVILVFLTMFYIFDYSFELSLILGSIAAAISPASTMMTIRQTRSKGDFVNTILQVIAMDNAFALILFSVSIAVITASNSPDAFTPMIIIAPILTNLAIVVLGAIAGWALHKLITQSRSTDNRLIIVIALLLMFSGVSAITDTSPLLGCMAMGMVYVNVSKDESLFRQVDYFAPPILTLFFVLSGMRLNLNSLATLGVAGIVYFFVRIIGKYAGASLGSVVAKSTSNNKKYLGLALIPQAGVSIGLAALGSRILEHNGFMYEATVLTTIILSSAILYEIFGPISAKLSLTLSKSYEVEDKDEMLLS